MLKFRIPSCVATVCLVLVLPAAASSQTRASSAGQDPAADQARGPWSALDGTAVLEPRLAPAGRAFAAGAQRRSRWPLGPAVTGAIAGGAVAVGVTYAAASRYGENEGGRFCGACFVQWSTVSVPVGATAGAVIGWGIGRARRSVTTVPVFSRSVKGVVVAARF